MRLVVRPKNVSLDEGLRESLEMRLQFALLRFQRRIREVVVILDDLNGPKGGVDKRCQVMVRLSPRGRIVIQETEGELRTAIARAADRAGRAVGRELERWRAYRTSGPGMSPRVD